MTKSLESYAYVSGISDEPLLYQTIYQALESAASKWSDHDAVISCHQNKTLTYDGLKQAVDKCAAALLNIGLKAGDRLGIWSPNNIEWLITQYATSALGIILVNINPAYRLSELEYALNKVGCKALICADRLKTSDYVAMISKLAPHLTGGKGGSEGGATPTLKHLIVITQAEIEGVQSFDAFLQNAPKAQMKAIEDIQSRLQPEQAINIQFTSGTTGSPKGATLTHHNILNNGYFVGEAIKLTPEDRVCVPVPLYHCFGMVMGNLAALTHGACVVYPDESFDAEKTLKAVQDEKCTALYGVPTMFVAMLEALQAGSENYQLTSLRTGIMAGAPCPVETMKRVIAEMNMSEVTICYGMTETSPVSFQSSCHDTLENIVSTVGRVHPHIECKIIDQDGAAVKNGVQGELCTRGYSVMQGYWEDPERTADAIDGDGWMHTGDLAIINDAGYAKITGRLKDMIIRGGENIYPLEVEEFLRTHDAVADAAVFGIPDEKYGEVTVAWICKTQVNKTGASNITEEEIRSYCKDNIAHYKMPKIIEFVEEFPMTVTGKVQKFEMRKIMCDKLQLSEVAAA